MGHDEALGIQVPSMTCHLSSGWFHSWWQETFRGPLGLSSPGWNSLALNPGRVDEDRKSLGFLRISQVVAALRKCSWIPSFDLLKGQEMTGVYESGEIPWEVLVMLAHSFGISLPLETALLVDEMALISSGQCVC